MGEQPSLGEWPTGKLLSPNWLVRSDLHALWPPSPAQRRWLVPGQSQIRLPSGGASPALGGVKRATTVLGEEVQSESPWRLTRPTQSHSGRASNSNLTAMYHWKSGLRVFELPGSLNGRCPGRPGLTLGRFKFGCNG